jgi:hypothetical protein
LATFGDFVVGPSSKKIATVQQAVALYEQD